MAMIFALLVSRSRLQTQSKVNLLQNRTSPQNLAILLRVLKPYEIRLTWGGVRQWISGEFPTDLLGFL